MRVLTYSRIAALARKGRRKPRSRPVVFHKRVERPERPKVSIILLDWSCRERFFTLEWLSRQDVSRTDY